MYNKNIEGDYYIGKRKNNCYEGRGEINIDETKYIGEWVKNERSGFGIATSKINVNKFIEKNKSFM